MQKQGIPICDPYKMFKNRNYNNSSQKRLAKFALIKYRINFPNYGIYLERRICLKQNTLVLQTCLFLLRRYVRFSSTGFCE